MSLPDTSAARSTGPYFQTYAEGRGAPVRWRLLSGNHRDLGRSVVDHVDVDDCRLGIARLLTDLALAEFGLVRAESHRWGWRLTAQGIVMASSGHSFDRRTRCEQGFALFVQLAPLAAVRDELSVWPARGRPAPSPDRKPLPGRVGPSWPVVHPRSADRSPRPGYLDARTGSSEPASGPREASR